ncbi:stress protein [Mycolicibacterium duvalii]|uniref:Uncharacterized protein n=1 Tax=Mycolicibacterium duvalii TaxID=39688 RepID=A0A7I7JWW9_9MYCO|nr:Dabb family protein [Mycolicibacterium duvalii]MCV7369599.1 Dabb family protein [Mycolicibacterium duvalii]PEG42221.1 stress protein [Mycolicibacterium duvalii]BBX16326.1 hypothetical protein MDUV_11860 [Mycolicibacterium duvalii]
MIRHVVLAKLKPGYDAAELSSIQRELHELNCPGTVRMTAGVDAGLRDGNCDFVIVADFTDADAFHGYDRDEAHNRVRARLVQMADQVSRAQFEIEG